MQREFIKELDNLLKKYKASINLVYSVENDSPSLLVEFEDNRETAELNYSINYKESLDLTAFYSFDIDAEDDTR